MLESSLCYCLLRRHIGVLEERQRPRETSTASLTQLRENKLYARPSKCTFFTDTIEYLGHIVGPDGIKPNPELVKEDRRGCGEFVRSMHSQTINYLILRDKEAFVT